MKKLLFVATYFPPVASGGNARQLRFLRYLPEFGWEPTVLTCPRPRAGARPRRGAHHPYAHADAGRRLRAGPQGHRPPCKRRAAAPRRRPPATPVRAVASSPTRSAAVAARTSTAGCSCPTRTSAGCRRPCSPACVWSRRRALRRDLLELIRAAARTLSAAGIAALQGLPWLADYRDPWPTHQYRVYPDAAAPRANFALERWALGHAAAVTAVNEQIADDLRRRYPALAPRVDGPPQRLRRRRGRRRRDAAPPVSGSSTPAACIRPRRQVAGLSRRPRRAARRRRRGLRRGRRRSPPGLRRIARHRPPRARRAVRAARPWRSAISAPPAPCCWSPATPPSRCPARSSSTCRAADPCSPSRPPPRRRRAARRGGRRRAARHRRAARRRPCGFVDRARAGTVPAADPTVLERYDARALTHRLADLLDGLADRG